MVEKVSFKLKNPVGDYSFSDIDTQSSLFAIKKVELFSSSTIIVKHMNYKI